MELFGQWDELPVDARASRAPLPHEDFDNYFDAYNEIDNLFNQTLTGLEDLDVPSGFANITAARAHEAKHSRKISGTAIFGFADHTRELSIGRGIIGDMNHRTKPSVDVNRYISPSEILTATRQPPIGKPIQLSEADEIALENEKVGAKPDYLVTNDHPKSYKFPPSSPSAASRPSGSSTPTINRFSAKYLQEINRSDLNLKQPYVDDIEPLLYEANFEALVPAQVSPDNTSPSYQYSQHSPGLGFKYVPIPATEPKGTVTKPQQVALHKNPAYLPPPSPPTLSNGSPDWQSSPEPQSPSPSRSFMAPADNSLYSSPVHQLMGQLRPQFQPQFFSDNDLFYPDDKQLTSSPYTQLPVHGFQSSPLRNTVVLDTPTRNHDHDDTIDANATVAQLTPLKGNYPMTPRNKAKNGLEWSPVISPDGHTRVTVQGVREAIQRQSPPKRKQTSLLPPGELDQHWEGPDEDKQFTCTFENCGKKFTRRYNVRSHIQTHLSDRPFACAYCPKKFVRQHDLNRHVKAHLENRHCRCLCGKVFTRLDAMRKHRVRHDCPVTLSSDDGHHVLKPRATARTGGLDILTSDRLTEEISSALKQDYD